MKFFSGPITKLHNPFCANWALGVIYAEGYSPPTSYQTLLRLNEELALLSRLKDSIDELKQIPSLSGFSEFTHKYGIQSPEINTLESLRVLEEAILNGHNGAGDNLSLINLILSLRTLKTVSCFDLKKIEGSQIHFRPGYAHETYLSPLGNQYSLQYLPLYADSRGFIGGPSIKTNHFANESSTNIVTFILSLVGMKELYEDMELVKTFYAKHTWYDIYHMEIIDGYPGVIDINYSREKHFTPTIPFSH